MLCQLLPTGNPEEPFLLSLGRGNQVSRRVSATFSIAKGVAGGARMRSGAGSPGYQPTCRRILSTTGGSVMKARIRISPPQWGQSKGSSSQTRWMSWAHLIL
jgi:hypothetical protein